MLWSLKNYFQLCTWKEKASLTFINHLLCSPAHSQVLYTCNSTQSSKQHMRDGAVWPENTGLKLLSNLPKFILLHKSHTSICFFFHTTWTSGNASIQVQNLRHVSHVSQGMCLDAAREEIMALFGFSKLHMYCDRYCSVVWSLNENVSHKFIYLKMGFRVRDTVWAGLGGMALIKKICSGNRLWSYKTTCHSQFDFCFFLVVLEVSSQLPSPATTPSWTFVPLNCNSK